MVPLCTHSHILCQPFCIHWYILRMKRFNIVAACSFGVYWEMIHSTPLSLSPVYIFTLDCPRKMVSDQRNKTILQTSKSKSENVVFVNIESILQIFNPEGERS